MGIGDWGLVTWCREASSNCHFAQGTNLQEWDRPNCLSKGHEGVSSRNQPYPSCFRTLNQKDRVHNQAKGTVPTGRKKVHKDRKRSSFDLYKALEKTGRTVGQVYF